jgi:WD40 repeat protein
MYMYSGKTSLLTVFFIFSFLLAIIPPAHAAEPLWTYSSPGSEIGGVTVSSDGSAIAVAGGKIWLFSKKGTLLAKEPFGDQVVFTPDGSSLVASYSSFLYQFKRITSPQGSESPLQKIWETELLTAVRSIDISDDGKTIVASVNGLGTYIYTSTGKRVGGDERYNALIRVSSNGGRIVGVSQGVMCLYSGTGICSESEERIVGTQPDFLELTGSGTIAVFNDAQRVQSVFLTNKTLRWTSRATGDATSLAMTPSGSGILVGTENGNVDLFDEYGNLSWSYASNPGNKQASGISCVALSKEGTVAAAGSMDGKIFALNSKGVELWSNQTKDHIRHIAMSSDGTLVVATGDETVYAFSTSPQSIPVVRTTVNALTPALSQSVTTIPGNSSAQKPETRQTTARAITALPTEYSVIRTATQSPLPGIISLGAILVALLMVMRRR